MSKLDEEYELWLASASKGEKEAAREGRPFYRAFWKNGDVVTKVLRTYCTPQGEKQPTCKSYYILGNKEREK